MRRRQLIKNSIILGIGSAIFPKSKAANTSYCHRIGMRNLDLKNTGPGKPVNIYNNWSSYDELSDNIPLTESLAMKQLEELLRLKKNGVQVDYYVMDAFWFDKAGGYRIWHKQHWPNGPNRWLEACLKNDIKPGMWFSINDRIESENGFFLDMISDWKDSACSNPKLLCLFEGGYLNHLTDTLQLWADKGVRAFKFDFANFRAANDEMEKLYLRSDIEEMNKVAFIKMLKHFRMNNPDVLILGYNGLGGEQRNTYTPFYKTVENRWLEVFDTLYCGDPRFSDVPTINIWRSQDVYSDHMVRYYEFNGFPLQRIDNCGFMIGTTGTCYKRANNAWKSMMLLELARGGWVNVYHGNLELLSDSDAEWFSKAQKLFNGLQQYGISSTFGGIPGKVEPYGFLAQGINGIVATVVNPSQIISDIKLPVGNYNTSSIIFTENGFKPLLKGNTLSLGPEQLVVVGFEEYSSEEYNLGVDRTIQIPIYIENIEVNFQETSKNTITGLMNPVKGTDIRILFQQFTQDFLPKRSYGGFPPDAKKMNEFFILTVSQEDKIIPVVIQYDKMIWSGLSWAAGEVKSTSFSSDKPIKIQCSTTETDKLLLKAKVYAVSYK